MEDYVSVFPEDGEGFYGEMFDHADTEFSTYIVRMASAVHGSKSGYIKVCCLITSPRFTRVAYLTHGHVFVNKLDSEAFISLHVSYL